MDAVDLSDLDFTFNPHSGRTPDQIRNEWIAYTEQLRTYRRQRTIVNATTAATDQWIESRRAWLDEQIAKCAAQMEILEDAWLSTRIVKPTDIPTPWTGATT